MDNALAQQALQKLRAVDSWAAIALLNDQDDIETVLEAYDALVRHLHWQARDLVAVLALGRAGVQVGLNSTDPAILGQVKTLAYNLASYLWPGWGEADLKIGPSDVAAGFEAARLNLRLGQRLQKGDLPLGRAYWMVGAYYLATGDPTRAATHFQTSADHAERAAQPGEVLLARGFAALSSGADEALAAIKTELSTIDDGRFFIEQIETAERVFGLSTG